MYVDCTVLEIFSKIIPLWIFRTSKSGLYFKGLFLNLLYLLEYSLNGTVSQFMNLIFVAKVSVQYETMNWVPGNL